MCKCGHEFEEHNPTGECLSPGCDCERFRDEYEDEEGL
jgi:hypothetical protein